MDEVTGLLDGIQASQEHITKLSEKIDELFWRQLEAEGQVFHRLKCLYQDGSASIVDMLDAYQMWASQVCAEGWHERWADAGLPSEDELHSLFVAGLKHQRNEPYGWSGDWKKATAASPMPPRGQSVVYILYDASNDPCYVGSTGDFAKRLADHRRGGKAFIRWAAYPCTDRAAAYLLEDRLLKENMPYLNKKRGA